MTATPRGFTSKTYSFPLDEQTRSQLRDLLGSLGAVRPEAPVTASVLTSDGARHELPAELTRALHDLATSFAEGDRVVIAADDTLLTTQEAADLLQVSRPTVVKLLDGGALPVVKRGSHRRVRLADVLDYDQEQGRDRADALSRMQQEGQETDLYALDGDAPVRR